MPSAVAGRREEGEYQVHGTVVHGLIGHRRIQPDEDSDNPIQPFNTCMREGHA